MIPIKLSIYFTIALVLSVVLSGAGRTLAIESTISSSTNGISVLSSTRALVEEPRIRVGLYKTKDQVKFVSEFTYQVYIGNEEADLLPENEEAILNYEAGTYTLNSASVNIVTNKPLRLVPAGPEAYFSLPSLKRSISSYKINFNKYRGTLEYRFSKKSQMPYIINDLPLEAYVAGVVEADNSSPEEYLKALQISARTYAYTQISAFAEKHLFDVYASTQDQLYLGYIAEEKLPNIVQATLKTTGQMVTYKGAPAVTFYFSRSDGKTRSWKKIGTLDKPWLRSVEAVYDKGKKMWGHGIGMSCNDAQNRAKKDRWTYEKILKYYYQGTEVERVY